VRALSLSDPVMANVASLTPSVETLVAMRSDWTGTGGYGGLAGQAVDSTGELSLDSLDAAIDTLLTLTRVVDRANPAQGIATMTPPYMLLTAIMNGNDGKPAPIPPYGPSWPEFFDEPQFPASWPQTSRAVQGSVAAIVDSIVRTVFGWRPDWVTTERDCANMSSLLFRPDARRGNFSATLAFLGTPCGCLNLSVSPQQGLTWVNC
jgi:hypothetical protein